MLILVVFAVLKITEKNTIYLLLLIHTFRVLQTILYEHLCMHFGFRIVFLSFFIFFFR